MCNVTAFNDKSIVFKPIVIEGPRDVSGHERLVVDSVITEKECNLLLELAAKVSICYVVIIKIGAEY